jgi:hypothetical protein
MVSQAKKEDTKLLAKLNREREQGRAGEREAFRQRAAERGIDVGGGGSSARTPSQLKQLQLTKVPDHLSNVLRAEKEFEKTRYPIVEIWFHYSRTVEERWAIYLETANGGRYSIIDKTLNYWGNRYLGRLRSFLALRQNKKLDFQGFTRLNEYYGAEAQRAHYEKTVENYALDTDRTYRPFSEQVKIDRQYGRDYRRYGPTIRGRYKPRKKK